MELTPQRLPVSAAALLVTSIASAQVPFTEIALVDISSTATQGAPQFIGSNPTAVAWDGTDLFVAGYNNTPTPADVSIVRVTDALNTATIGAAFATQAATPGSRGYTGLDISGGMLAAAYDSGAASAQGITSWMPDGTLLFAHSARGSSGIGFDPDLAGGGTPPGTGWGWPTFSSGRRSLNDVSGAVVYDTTNGMIVHPGGGTFWRDIDFDDATGNAYLRRSNDVVVATRTGSNSCTTALLVDNLENGAFISQQSVAYIDSTAFGELIIYNDRMASGPNQGFSFIVRVVDPSGIPVNVVFSENNGDPNDIAPGNGAYDFSWDRASETLAMLDFTNRNVHIFVLGDAPMDFVEGCNGDGGDQMGCTDCPCGNNAALGTIGGCLNSAASSTRLIPSGSASISQADLRMEASGAPPANSAVLTSGGALAPANMANPCFGLGTGVQSVSLDGLRCAVQGVLRHGVRPSDANGDIGVTTNGWGTPNGFFNFGAFVAGATRHLQIIHRDDAGLVCQTGQNTSQAVSVAFQP